MMSETRPLLMPQNRKLRHLKGIYLRNLSFTRPEGRAVDDSELTRPSSISAKKRPSLKELQHTRSSESLRSAKATARRGSVLMVASAAERQKRLEGSVDEKVADGFFSVHCEGEEEPVYISEVVERSSNFNFQFFDLKHHHPGITRRAELTVRFWTRKQNAWTLLLEEVVDLKTLQFIGSLENRPFPPNGLIFHLTDGMYSADMPGRPRKPKSAPAVPTSSYNALMKLATLDNSIQDALATQQSITAQINDILERRPVDKVPQAEDRLDLAKKYVVQERRALAASEKRKKELEESIRARRAAIRKGRALQEKAERDVANARRKLGSSKEAASVTREQIHGQRRRICSDLSDIFNISPVPDGPPLSFQICGIPLPNTTFDAATSRTADENALSAALGYVSILTDFLQYYLSTPLPYPITAFGSRSSIRDDISLLTDLTAQYQTRGREFPLYLPRGGSTAAHFRFEYAWFLLNKDIEALCASQGLRVIDIRQTLPNLKYLLYVCSAGTDEVPERKRGGVRGLLMGRLNATRAPPALDSEPAGFMVGSESPSVDGENGEADGSVIGSHKGLPFGEAELKLSLRRKGMSSTR
ncbi:hypothetical protein jhhlp_005248 [Lomentospora prolificans]|uniref:Autophagy-related protein 14 n=1 Tax=Lomentospora prolificans TaxID=41688 RepID=A0A2N3N7C4_9PEZI|nr:hypothetical protein jhhlp_005248 [Lomentospora prolificans]